MATVSTPSAPKQNFLLSHAPLIIAFITFTGMAMPAGVLNVAWTRLHTDLSQPFEALGILLGVGISGRIVATFIAGRMIAHFGVWKVLMFGILSAVIGTFGYLWSPVWGVLLTASVFFAVGWGLLDIGMNLLVAARYPHGVINVLHGSFGLGLTLGPLVATAILTAGGDWRVSYLPSATMAVGIAVGILLTRPRWVVLRQNMDEPLPPAASIPSTLRLPGMKLWLIMILLYGGVEVGIGQLATSLLTGARGVDVATAGTWVSLYWGMFTVVRIASGLIANRFSERNTMTTCMTLGLIGTALLLFDAPTLNLIGLLVAGAGLAATFPTMVAHTPRRVGLHHAPNAVGFLISAASAGTAILPGIGAFLATRLGFGSIAPFMFAMMALTLVLYLLIARREVAAEAAAVKAGSQRTSPPLL